MGSLSARGRSQNPAAHSIPLGSPLSSTPPLPPIVTIQEEQNNSSRLPSLASASTSEPAPPPVSTYTGPISWPRPNSSIPLYADQGEEWLEGEYTIGGKDVYLDAPPLRDQHRQEAGMCERCTKGGFPAGACWYPQQKGACFACRQMKKRCAPLSPSRSLGRRIMDYILIPARRRNNFSKTSPPIAVRRIALRAAVAKPKVKRPVFARSSSLEAGPSRRRRSPSESCSEKSLSSSPTPAPRARRRAASPRRSARRALSSRARM
ncbi:hypothetical protein H0H92_014407, partial [Tricholoma furcatifolium]